MTDDATLTYSVIITISLPGESGETSLRLTLGPADQVPAPGESTRLLQDCTLAELQQFADALEADLWRDYLDATLVDMVVDDSLQINYMYDAGEVDSSPTSELLLDHVVIFPEAAAPESEEIQGESEEEPIEPEVAVDFDLESKIDDTSGEDGDREGESVPESPVVDQPTVTDEEPDVTVAETEPVHEEREALTEPDLQIVLPSARILGRRRPLGHGTRSAVDILINETSFRDTQAHAISSPDREVAGVLIGPPPEKQPDGRYVVHISDMIIAKHTRMQGASVTYTPES
jgi:hypothetical protein